MRTLHGKVALVTGGARGFGQAIAHRLAQDGADIVIADTGDGAETVRIVEATGRAAVAIRCDISAPDQVAMLQQQIDDRFGRCDILVNNAGIYPTSKFEDIALEEWRRVMSVNVDGPFLLAKAFLPGMRRRSWGRIVNIASNTISRVITERSSYITSKTALVGFTRALASEYGPYGITVNAVSPGRSRTPGVLEDVGGAAAAEERFQAAAKLQAIPRVQEPSDLVGAVSFLCSDDTAFITGQLINVDGGLVRSV